MTESECKGIHVGDAEFVEMVLEGSLFFKEQFDDVYIRYTWNQIPIHILILSRGEQLLLQFSRKPVDPMMNEALRIQVSFIILQIKNWLEGHSKHRLKILMKKMKVLMDDYVIKDLADYYHRLHTNYLEEKTPYLVECFQNAATLESTLSIHPFQSNIRLRFYGRDGERLARYLHTHWKVPCKKHADSLELNFESLFKHEKSVLYLYHRFEDIGYSLTREEADDDCKSIHKDAFRRR